MGIMSGCSGVRLASDPLSAVYQMCDVKQVNLNVFYFIDKIIDNSTYVMEFL